MKKIFRLSAIVAMLSMMATTATFTSCSDDDDEEEGADTEVVENDWSKATTSIAVKPGDKFLAKCEGVEYKVTVVKAAEGAVTLNVNGTEVELSDAGTSFLSKEIKGMYQKDAEAAPQDVIMVLAKGTQNVISGTKASNSVVSAAANETKFLAQ